MNVAIIAHTPDIEKVIASAAKLCYSQVGVEEISESMDTEQANVFLEKLMTFGHYSPLEHASFTFAVEGVSRVLTHQLVRHRIASYSQQSQRYVKLDQFEYIIPPAIEENEVAKALFVKAMQSDQETYNQLTEVLEATLIEKNMQSGMSEKKARAAAEKKAIEDARFVFPNACESKIVLTMNLRSLHNFFEHRCCERAQWEIRALAVEMLRQVKAVAPTLFEKSGPSCVRGVCKEGKMTCGNSVAVRAFFESL